MAVAFFEAFFFLAAFFGAAFLAAFFLATAIPPLRKILASVGGDRNSSDRWKLTDLQPAVLVATRPECLRHPVCHSHSGRGGLLTPCIDHSRMNFFSSLVVLIVILRWSSFSSVFVVKCH